MLRNIRNMEKASVDRSVIAEGLENINGRMLLPLDFLKAAKVNPNFKDAIETAMVNSYATLPKLKGKTLFIVDVSGSMRCGISSNTNFDRLDCACAMAMLAANQCEEFKLVATAGNDYTRVCSSAQITNPEKGFRIIEQIKDKYSHLGGGGIFTRQCLEWCKSQLQLSLTEKIIRLLTACALTILLAFFFFLVVIFLSFAAVYALSLFVPLWASFLIVAGVQLLLFVVIYCKRHDGSRNDGTGH